MLTVKDASQAIFLGAALLLESKLNTKFFIEADANDSSVVQAECGFLQGVKIRLSTNGNEIQCLYIFAKDVPGQTGKAILLQSSQNHPRPIYARQMSQLKYADVQELARNYAESIISFLVDLQSATD